MLGFYLLSIDMLSVVMLRVVAPYVSRNQMPSSGKIKKMKNDFVG
jgi:hypothetical protein